MMKIHVQWHIIDMNMTLNDGYLPIWTLDIDLNELLSSNTLLDLRGLYLALPTCFLV